MVLSTTETTTAAHSIGLWTKGKPNTAAPLKGSHALSASPAVSENQEIKPLAARPFLPTPIEEKHAKPRQRSKDKADQEAEVAAPDFTLQLSNPQTALVTSFQDTRQPLPEVHPYSTKNEKKEAPKGDLERAQLPYTFDFGRKRPLALAVAMSRPQIGNQKPGSFNQAIQQTFDLAATNIWLYAKGGRVSLLA